MPRRALAPGRNDSFLFALPCPASHKAWLTGPPPSVQGRGGSAAEAFAALWASSPSCPQASGDGRSQILSTTMPNGQK